MGNIFFTAVIFALAHRDHSIQENVSVFELQSIRIIDCNSAIQLMEQNALRNVNSC
jgi:hypothetical protein